MFFGHVRNRGRPRFGGAAAAGGGRLGTPVAASSAIWRSISEFSSAPHSTMMADIHIHIIRPMAAPSEP